LIGERGEIKFGGGLTARTVGVENACHAYVDTVLVVETVRQGFGDAFPLIVACAWTDGVDVTPATNKGSDIDQSNLKSNALVRRHKD
jgi:hypothetical protein